MPRGREADYKPLYIIRAEHGGVLIPGKFNGDWGQAYISYAGGEHIVSSFEVPHKTFSERANHQISLIFKFFVATNVKWQPASNGVILANAVVGGGRPGANLYIGRVKYNGSIVPGKIDTAHGCLYIPYGGREIKFTDYEQLVYV